jgi:hypothetical protein
MTAIEQAIKEAVEKGRWRPPFILRRVERELGFGKLFYQMYSGIFLDPSFWQALGKARRWDKRKGDKRGVPAGNICYEYNDEMNSCEEYREWWKENMHRFIDHLAEGKDAESFFSSLN